MGTQVGVWIDHQRAVIAPMGAGAVTVVRSDLPDHVRFSRGGGHPGGDSAHGGASEHHREEQHRQALDRYLDRVIQALGRPQALLVCGPGEAKHELRTRLLDHTSPPHPVISVESADKLTDAQLIAKVTVHFGTPAGS